MMKNGKLLVAPALLWLSIFFVIPLLIVVAVSFAGRTPYGQVIFSFTFDNYLRFLEPLYLKIFADTLVVAIIATLATILMGYPLAYTITQLPKKMAATGADPGHDPLLNQLPDPFLRLGHHPALTGRSQYAAVKAGPDRPAAADAL